MLQCPVDFRAERIVGDEAFAVPFFSFDVTNAAGLQCQDAGFRPLRKLGALWLFQ